MSGEPRPPPPPRPPSGPGGPGRPPLFADPRPRPRGDHVLALVLVLLGRRRNALLLVRHREPVLPEDRGQTGLTGVSGVRQTSHRTRPAGGQGSYGVRRVSPGSTGFRRGSDGVRTGSDGVQIGVRWESDRVNTGVKRGPTRAVCSVLIFVNLGGKPHPNELCCDVLECETTSILEGKSRNLVGQIMLKTFT